MGLLGNWRIAWSGNADWALRGAAHERHRHDFVYGTEVSNATVTCTLLRIAIQSTHTDILNTDCTITLVPMSTHSENTAGTDDAGCDGEVWTAEMGADRGAQDLLALFVLDDIPNEV